MNFTGLAGSVQQQSLINKDWVFTGMYTSEVIGDIYPIIDPAAYNEDMAYQSLVAVYSAANYSVGTVCVVQDDESSPSIFWVFEVQEL